jgi:O-methyltransferase
VAEDGHEPTRGQELQDRYLSLMKGCLTRLLFHRRGVPAHSFTEGCRRTAYAPLTKALDKRNLQMGRGRQPRARAVGRDWPPHGETMAGMARIDNVQDCVTDVLRTGAPAT